MASYMSIMFGKIESQPPLHQVIIARDYVAIERLSHFPQLLSGKNSLGFTPLELAYFLGDKRSVKILISPSNRLIPVQKPLTTTSEQMTEAEFEKFFHVLYRSHLNFQEYAFFQKIVANSPWLLCHTSWGEENRQLAQQYQSELANGTVADVTVRWIDDQLQYGVFANRDFPTGTYIGQYTGILRQLSRRRPDPNAYCFHYPTRWWSWNYIVIDSSREGNEMRFINHSDTPNLTPLCVCDRNILYIIFIAICPIAAGSQLAYDYGKDFWRHREKVAIGISEMDV